MSTNSSNKQCPSVDRRTKTDDLKLYEMSHKDALVEIENIVCGKQSSPLRKEMNFPKLVLIVIGDSTAFVPKRWQTSVFKAGIVAIAKGAQDCLILSEGTNKKVSTLVKQAVDDFDKLQHESTKIKQEKKNLNSKSIEENKSLQKCFVHSIYLLRNEVSTDGANCSVEEDESIRQGERRYISRLSEIAKGISEKWTPLILLNPERSEEKSLYMRVPVVTIVAEGDLKTIRIVRRIVQQDLPVLIMKGSGKAADFIADFIEQDTEINLNKIKAKTSQFFGIVFHENDDSRLEKNIKIIMENKCLVTVLNINADIDTSAFTEAVTNSVIVSWSKKAAAVKEKDKTDKDIRRKSITLHAMSRKPEPLMEEYTSLIKTSTLPLYYFAAYQYINEIDTANERTKETILPQFDDPTDFQHILKWGPKRPRERLLYLKENSDENSSWQCVLSGRQICQSMLSYKKKEYSLKPDNNWIDENVFNDLLIWAILANRPILATLFWTKSCHQFLGVLFVSSLYKNLARHVKKNEQHSAYNLWFEQAGKFAAIALNLQDKLYTEEPKMTMELLAKREKIWDIEASPLECAHENRMYDIIAHKSSQRQLNSDWYRDMGASSWGIWKAGCFLGCCCLCPQGIRCCCLFGKESTFNLPRFFITPFAKFLLHYLFHLIALFCFSAFILVELDDFSGVASIEGYEWLVYLYVVTDMAEEYRKSMLTTSRYLRTCLGFSWKKCKGEKKVLPHTCCYNIKKYFYDVWNCMDVFSYLMIILAAIFRFTNSPIISTKVVRRTYSVALFAMYMRFLRVLLMSRKLGPKIIMIKEMFKDLFRFIGILFVFMMGVGVLYHANMYPKHVDMWSQKGWEYWRIWKIISIPYWQIYGEPNLETFEDNSTTPCTTIKSQWESNPDIERCSQYDPILVIVAALYMLVSNLLLVNLVIALFSYSFEKVQKNSERLWRYMRFEIIDDFKTRIPAPLNLLWRPLLAICLFCHQRKNRISPEETGATGQAGETAVTGQAVGTVATGQAVGTSISEEAEGTAARETEETTETTATEEADGPTAIEGDDVKNQKTKILKLQEMMSLKCVNEFV